MTISWGSTASSLQLKVSCDRTAILNSKFARKIKKFVKVGVASTWCLGRGKQKTAVPRLLLGSCSLKSKILANRIKPGQELMHK